MNREIEVKILEIDVTAVNQKLQELEAVQTFHGLIMANWFRPIGVKEGEDPWFLRVRTKEGQSPEITWKSRSHSEEKHHIAEEIDVLVNDFKNMCRIFESIGLEQYAYQEKYRTSWKLQDCIFDIDEYPGIPPFIEIEAPDSTKIQDAIDSLQLQNNPTWSRGERLLIQQRYKKDWYAMQF